MIIQISFNASINVSAQVGDMVYYTTTNTNAGFNTSSMGNVVGIGPITQVVSSGNSNYILVQVNNQAIVINQQPQIPGGAFIMFAKDNGINISGVIGHYANVNMKNESEDKVELYSLGGDVIENSK